MSIVSQQLNSIVDGSNPNPPPMVGALRLPPIAGWEKGRVWGIWDVDPEMFHAGGAVFGGYLAALADSFLSLAMFSTLADDEMFTTADLRISFFRPVSEGRLNIEATVIHRGRRMGQVEASFTTPDGKLAARATATEVVMPASGE